MAVKIAIGMHRGKRKGGFKALPCHDVFSRVCLEVFSAVWLEFVKMTFCISCWLRMAFFRAEGVLMDFFEAKNG